VGKITCFSLIDSVSINNEGQFQPKSKEALTLVRTMQRLHDSWFPRFNFNISTQDYPNTDIYDANEMGYHFTWSLFKDEPIRNVITKKRSFRGQRQASKEHRYFIDRNIKGFRHLRVNDSHNRWKVGGAYEEDDDEYQGPVTFWEPELVQFGNLFGLKKYMNSPNHIKRWLGGDTLKEYDIHEPKGGGVMGTVPYLLLNAGHSGKKMDGGFLLHRRWSTAVLNDLMCRTLPLLTKNDAKKFVKKNSQISFRKKAVCMSCHATIDPMAAVLRNMEAFNSGNPGINYTIRNIYLHKTDSFHKGELPDSDQSFFRTKPRGSFLYKALSGQISHEKISSLNDLGRLIANTDDFYICAASRYLDFFTGKKIAIEQIDWSQNTSEVSLLKKLGQKLMKSQSLKVLIKEIISLPLYGGDK